VKLPYDLAVASNDEAKTTGGFDGKGDAIPAELLPASLVFNGITFQLGPAKSGAPNAVVAKGQTIALPAAKFNRVYVLAAAVDGDQTATFHLGSQAVDVVVENWGGFIGQWDDRIWEAVDVPVPGRGGQPARTRRDPYGKLVGLRPGFMKSAAVAWYASHHHNAEGANVPYSFSYLFAYPIDVPAGAQSITLPDNDRIRVLAISTADENAPIVAAHPLFDTLQ
jgi:alpha-mannosidase